MTDETRDELYQKWQEAESVLATLRREYWQTGIAPAGFERAVTAVWQAKQAANNNDKGAE